MKKQCITHREFKLILDDLRKETDVLMHTKDLVCDEGSQKQLHFYHIELRKFETFPMFIGKIHETYGRDIDVRTYYGYKDTLVLNVRGYEKELR